MKHVLMLAPVPITGAATRFRLQQFVPFLRSVGIDATIRPFLTDAQLRLLYGRAPLLEMARVAVAAIEGRLADLNTARSADAVVIQREAALVGPPVLEWILARRMERKVIFDVDDAVWEPYDSPTYGRWLSRLLKMPGKTHFSLRAATEIVAGNKYVASYARRYNPRVTLVPTVVDTTLFVPKRCHNAVPVVGWIGTHSTAPYLARLLPALSRLAKTHKFILRVVGAHVGAPGVASDVRPWALEREVSDFQSLDVGLYPIVDDAWSRGKSGFKAIQYMACGVPVVASPVGATLDIVREGENGFLAATERAWVESLKVLLENAALRRRMGDAGRENAVEHWSLHKFAPVVADVLLRAIA